MAVYTMDGTFLQPMPERLGESGRRLFMTIKTQLIRLAGQQVDNFLCMVNAVAIRASQLVLAVQTGALPGVCFGPGVASEAIAIHVTRGEFRKGSYLAPVTSIHMGLPGPVAGLATLVFPAFLGVCLENLMGVPSKLCGHFLVAGAAGRGTDILIRGRWSSFLRLLGSLS